VSNGPESGRTQCAFEERWLDTTVVVSCIGEIDMTTTPELERRIAQALHQSPAALIVDLSRVDFLASSGMGALVATHETCTPDVNFAVVAHGPLTRRPMELVGVTDTVTVRPSLDSAVAAVAT
jgi:anti-sigma B factor antagonist